MAINVMPISHQTEKTVCLARDPRPNTVAGIQIPNRIFMVLLFRDSLITAIPLPSKASLIAVITSGITGKYARTSIPRMVLFTPHTLLKNTAERTIPILVTMMTITAATPNHIQDHDFCTRLYGPLKHGGAKRSPESKSVNFFR